MYNPQPPVGWNGPGKIKILVNPRTWSSAIWAYESDLVRKASIFKLLLLTIFFCESWYLFVNLFESRMVVVARSATSSRRRMAFAVKVIKSSVRE